MIGPTLVHLALIGVSTAVMGGLAGYAYRHRDEPGAEPFAALMVSTTVWAGAYGVSLLVREPSRRMVMEQVQWLGVVGIPVWLVLFALAYTGHDEFLTRRTVGGLCLLPALVAVATWTNDVHGLMWTDADVLVRNGLSLVELSWGPMFWVYIVYTYALVAVAVTLVLRLVFLSDYLYAGQSALLVVGITAPLFGNVFDLFGPLTGPSIEVAPYAFTVTGLSFGYALFRRRLFDLVPATRQLGRNTAIGQLEDGVLIVDTARRIVYCNAAAGEVLDCDPAAAVGREVRDLVDESRLDFEAADALVEVERDERTYEIRTSPITDRRDRQIGHTLVIHDVTTRKERERKLAAQRDELERLDDLNATIRGVNQALVSATSREEIERAVCERVLEADRYATTCVADLATWTGDADRWFVAGRGAETDGAPPEVGEKFTRDDIDPTAAGSSLPAVEPDAGSGSDTDTAADVDPSGGPTVTDGTDSGSWLVVPLVYGRTVYGALGLYTDDAEVTERECEALGELGETIGLAIDAVETRQLLSAETVVELELACGDEQSPLVAASTDSSGSGDGTATLELAGLVPGDDGTLAYVRVEDGDPTAVRDRLAAAATGAVRTVRDSEDDRDTGLLEWQVTGDSLLGALSDRGVHVQRARADGGQAQVDVEIASDAGARSLLDDLEGPFPDTRLVSKRERSNPPSESDRALSEEGLADLTDRQREVIEVAYRAGYFNWPRDSTAEEVADSLDISSPTLHSHLRQAEQSLLADLFEPDPPRRE